MGTPSYLWRPRLAPFATSGCPFYLPERGWAQNSPPLLVAGTQGTLLLRRFSPFLLAVKKSTIAAYTWVPVEGSGALQFPFTHMPPIASAPPRVLYPEGPEL